MQSLSVIQERLDKQHNSTVSIVVSTYHGYKKRATFVDKYYGSWNAFVYAVCRGTKHPQRAKEEIRTKTLSQIKARLYSKFHDTVKIVESSFKTYESKCYFIDSEYGEWFAQPGNVLNGCGHPIRATKQKAQKRTYSQIEVEQMIFAVHKTNVVLVEPYKGMLHNHHFIDNEFGEFSATISNVIHKGTGHIKRAVQRREQTSYKNYGTRHPMQNVDVHNKNIKSTQKYIHKVHWKTGESLLCVSSYEVKVVDWLNSNKTDFLWQPKTFHLPSGTSYRPDLYLIQENKWIEIKGYFREKSKLK